MLLKSYILPQEKILGIAVSKNSLRGTLLTKDGKILYQAIVGLKEKFPNSSNQKNFEKSLLFFIDNIRKKNKIPKQKEISTILTIPTSLTFNKHFYLPSLNKKDFLSAIDLNLKLFSPIKANTISGWQIIKKYKENNRSIILASFIKERNISPLEKNIRKSNLLLRAIEFHSMSLNRLIKEQIFKNKPKINWITLYFNENGIDTSVSLRGNICLSFFNEWDNDNPTEKEVYSLLKRSLVQTINYFKNNFQDEENIKKTFILGENMTIDKIRKIKDKMKEEVGLEIEIPFNNSVSALSLGAALRGKTLSLEDKEISLSNLSIIKEYNIYQAKIYLNYWGKIFSSASLAMLGIFFASYLILNKINSNLKSSSFLRQDTKKIELANHLKQEAKQFNSLLSEAIQLNKKTYYMDEFLKEIFNLSKKYKINIEKIYIKDPLSQIKVIAKTNNLDNVSFFKKNLKKLDRFSNISLPATAQKQVGNEFIFEIDFKYRFK